VITAGATLWTDELRPVGVSSVEFGSEYAADRVTLLVERSAEPAVPRCT
jgi:hypothetical protein